MKYSKGDKVKIQIWFDKKVGVITDFVGGLSNIYKVSVDGMSYTKGEKEIYSIDYK